MRLNTSSRPRGRWVMGWAVVLGLGVWAQRSCLQPSGWVHCVQVAQPGDFTGRWLAHRQAQWRGRVPQAQCQQRDQQLDGRDGPRAGRVRWADCVSGPDCDEAGLF